MLQGYSLTVPSRKAPPEAEKTEKFIADFTPVPMVMPRANASSNSPLRSANAREQGGLSGAPLFEPSTRILREMRRRLGAQVTLIGVGGISSGEDAYTKIRVGASLVQLYTALTYEGPSLVGRIKRELLRCLERDGFAHVSDAVGTDV